MSEGGASKPRPVFGGPRFVVLGLRCGGPARVLLTLSVRRAGHLGNLPRRQGSRSDGLSRIQPEHVAFVDDCCQGRAWSDAAASPRVCACARARTRLMRRACCVVRNVPTIEPSGDFRRVCTTRLGRRAAAARATGDVRRLTPLPRALPTRSRRRSRDSAAVPRRDPVTCAVAPRRCAAPATWSSAGDRAATRRSPGAPMVVASDRHRRCGRRCCVAEQAPLHFAAVGAPAEAAHAALITAGDARRRASPF